MDRRWKKIGKKDSTGWKEAPTVAKTHRPETKRKDRADRLHEQIANSSATMFVVNKLADIIKTAWN